VGFSVDVIVKTALMLDEVITHKLCQSLTRTLREASESLSACITESQQLLPHVMTVLREGCVR
jgi:hypothetical protein